MPRSRPDPFDRPLDALLERARVHGLRYVWSADDLAIWTLTCLIDGESVILREANEGGPVTIQCAGGCHESRIVAALAAEPRCDEDALALAEAVSAIASRALELLEASCR